jgi:hypothetical protein
MAFQAPAYIGQPLQAPYNFHPNTGFVPFVQYIQGQAATANQSPYKAAPIVVSYADAHAKQRYINSADPAALPTYQAGVTVSTATRYYPSRQGGVGVIVSPMDNAAQQQHGANSWHAVGVLRQGQTMWIHDPAYQIGSQTRLPMISGLSNVQNLMGSHGFGNINQIQVQGWNNGNLECMGRSAQWFDNVIQAPGALAPYPLGTFVPGQVTPGWQVIQRY